MARPRVRTATLPHEEVAALKMLFGTVTNAYARLMPGGQPLTWAVFRVVAAGAPCRPRDLAATRSALAAWKRQRSVGDWTLKG